MLGSLHVHVNFILVFISTTTKCNSVQHLVGQILLTKSYTNCESLDLNQDRVICEIYSEEDENNLVCQGLSRCKMPVTLCPDGSINKTCFPTKDDNFLSYRCICHSQRRSESIVPVTEWTTWMTSTSPYQSFISERSLIVPSLDLTILQEFTRYRPTNVYIISHYQLPSSVYSASTTHSSEYPPYKASIDYIVSYRCSWAAVYQVQSWLQMILPTEYVVVGTVIRQRCDTSAHGLQYASRVKITRSADGVSWQTVIESENLIYDSYDGQGSCSVWFSQPHTDRFWRIHIINFVGHPSMKADLIGYK